MPVWGCLAAKRANKSMMSIQVWFKVSGRIQVESKKEKQQTTYIGDFAFFPFFDFN